MKLPHAEARAPRTRREFFANLFMGFGLVFGVGGLVGRFLTYLYPVVPPIRLVEYRAGRRDSIPKGGAKLFNLPTARVMVVDTDAGLKAFSAVCTHLGCIVRWNDARKQFICPCHKGTYDTAGHVVSGPPPRPLDELKVAVKDDEVFVSVPTQEAESVNMRLRKFMRSRVPVNREALLEALREQIPVHLKEWIFCLGGTPLVLFAILAVTGILLTFYYVPEPAHAFDSVKNITYHARFGWFVRGIHRGASQLMIIAVLLHMIRVFGTRAYRRPRELNWMVGVALLLTTLGFAFTGYSLVYDQLSYWATTVGTNMIGAVPGIGAHLLNLLRGGPDVNPNTLTRFYNFHIGVMPTLMVLLVGLHILFIRLHGVAPLQNDARTEKYPFFPDHVLKETIIGLVILIALVNYVIFFPPDIGIRADPFNTPSSIRPEWYFYPSYRWLKLVPMQVGLWGSVFYILCMFCWPFIDRACERIAPGKGLARVIGVCGFMVTVVFLVWEALAG